MNPPIALRTCTCDIDKRDSSEAALAERCAYVTCENLKKIRGYFGSLRTELRKRIKILEEKKDWEGLSFDEEDSLTGYHDQYAALAVHLENSKKQLESVFQKHNPNFDLDQFRPWKQENAEPPSTKDDFPDPGVLKPGQAAPGTPDDIEQSHIESGGDVWMGHFSNDLKSLIGDDLEACMLEDSAGSSSMDDAVDSVTSSNA